MNTPNSFVTPSGTVVSHWFRLQTRYRARHTQNPFRSIYGQTHAVAGNGRSYKVLSCCGVDSRDRMGEERVVFSILPCEVYKTPAVGPDGITCKKCRKALGLN